MSHYIPTDKDIQRFWAKVDKSGGDDACWKWIGGKANKGYGAFRMGGKQMNASRATWLIVYGHINDGLQVCHHCDNPPCCNPKHLFLGTPKDNSQDMSRKGRFVVPGLRGEQVVTHKLTNEQVHEMRQRYANGEMTYRMIVKEYGISQTQVGRIINGEAWRNKDGSLV